jgi:hypothetical protein
MELLFAAPALPLDEAGKYVAGAYIVFVVLLVVYVAIMAAKLQRIERDLREVAAIAEERKDDQVAPGRGSETPLAAHGSGGGDTDV